MVYNIYIIVLVASLTRSDILEIRIIKLIGRGLIFEEVS